MLESETDALGHVTRYAWNTRGQLAHRADALGHRVEFEYDSAGRLAMLFNENRQAYRFDYDAADQLKAQTGLDGLRSEYTLDALGLPIEVRQAAGSEDETTLSFERDLLGRLSVKTTPETITRYAYDAANQLVHIERHARQENAPLDALDFAYDARGNLVEETSTQFRLDGKPLESPRTRTLRHDHDALGNRTATVLPQGNTLNYLYYGSGHLHQINLDGKTISDLARDATHREIARSQGELLSRFQRDTLGRITARHAFFWREAWAAPGATPEVSAEPNAFPPAGDATLRRMGQREGGDVVLKGFAFDANGELTRRIDPVIGEQRYAYDALGRITAALPGSGARQPDERFDWDAASNPREPGWPEPPRDNRITRWGDRRYEYDTRGRLTAKRIGSHTEIRLRWNSENQLVASETRRTGTQLRTRYDYDALGRRIAKHDAFGTTFFTWEGMRLIQEERGATVLTHVYEPGSYVPLARIDSHRAPAAPDTPAATTTTVHYLHNNINGAPEEMTDARGALIWQARYAVWGNTVVEHWHREHRPDPSGLAAQSPLPQNLRMQGQYADPETGLCYNTFRYYDPDIGRFISQDPIGLAGGMNLYQYAPNPISWIDPWGWLKEGETAGYGSKSHGGDGLEAHEILRNKLLQNQGIGNGKRVKGNPSIALSPVHHDQVHAEENRLRRQMGLSNNNQMLRRGKLEIKLMSRSIHNVLVAHGIITPQQARIARKMATSFAKANRCY